MVNRVCIAYLTTVNLLLAFFVITAFIPRGIGVECDDAVVSWQWLAITLLDTAQTLALTTAGCMMFKSINNNRQSDSLLNELKEDMNDRFTHQVKYLIVFYIFAAFMDWPILSSTSVCFKITSVRSGTDLSFADTGFCDW